MLEALRRAGLPVTAVIGAGMEGTVAALDADRVVKLWARRDRADLERQRVFYDAVHAAGLTLRVPRILEVVAVGERWASVQERLVGEPLWTDQDTSPPRSAPHARAMVKVLDALVTVRPTNAMAVLPLAAGAAPFDPSVPFGDSMAALAEQRVVRDGAVLRQHLPDLDQRAAALAGALRALPALPGSLVHGDLGPANILAVDGRPASLLDFGYLTTVGDPAYDAAVAATLFDMFGEPAGGPPGPPAAEVWLDELVADRFGYDRERIVVHRAAYALVTASCLAGAADGRHFAWCVDILRRPETSHILGL